MKSLLEKAFINSQSRLFFVVSDILALVTIISIVALVIETVPALFVYENIFNFIEWFAVVIFSIEYISRLYVAKPWHKYSLSFFGAIDLVAIAPTLLGLGNFTFLKSARIVRIIRLLRLVRLAKISRVHQKDPDESLGVFTLNIAIYTVLLLSSLLVFGTTLYIVESTTEVFSSIPSGMWWALKVFVGSIPVEAPLTAFGSVLYVAARFVGLVLLGVLLGVIGNIFRQVLLSKPSSKQ
ncbi:ion transporter [Candidatus Pacebacteria bacterium]|nr:ion transporter [Candidatus Paceibacterota bacterium]